MIKSKKIMGLISNFEILGDSLSSSDSSLSLNLSLTTSLNLSDPLGVMPTRPGHVYKLC